MKKFSFSLRSVGVLRTHQESKARELFAAAVHAYVQAEEVHAEARARSEAFEAEIRAGWAGSCRAAEAANLFGAYRRECALEIESERVVFAARAEMERCRGLYIEAHRRLEAMQRLEQKARLTHRRETNRIEQAEFDALGGRRLASFTH